MTTSDELFGPEAKTSSDLFGPEIDPMMSMDSPPYDRFFTGSPGEPGELAAGILDKFAVGFKEGFGTRRIGLSEETEADLKHAGIFNDYDKGQKSLLREAYAAVLRPTAATLDLAMRAVYGTVRGLAETEPAYTGPLQPLAAIAAGRLESMGPEAVAHLPLYDAAKAEALTGGLNRAADLGISTGETSMQANEEALRSLTPKGVESPTERIVSPAVEERPPPVKPDNIHDLVRFNEPELFSEYDWLDNARTVMANHARILADEAKRPIENNINGLLDSVNGDESQLDRRQTRQLTALRKQLEEFQEPEEVTAARLQSQKFDSEMRDLAPQVSEAYRRANEELPRVEEEPPPAVVETANPDAVTPEEVERRILNLSQRAPTIAQIVARDLQAAGQNATLARANGAIAQAYYETRAARFGGALGSAQDLFDAEAPSIKAGEGAARGKLSLAQNTLTLFKNADASTFLHESAHGWLEDMLKDAQHPEAPPDLINDLNAVKGWLGMTAERPTRAQHEQFARGFERYMMEGTAPNTRLASVFAKFKDWLTKIYNTVKSLKAPITDDIRGVYDRLINRPNSEAIIAPDRVVGADFADIHEAEAPKATVVDADRMRAERDQIAQILPTEINNARRRARIAATKSTEARRTPEGSPVAEPGGGGTGPQSIGAESNAAPPEIRERRVTSEASKPPADANGDFEPAGTGVTRPDGSPILENIETPTDIDDALRSAPGNDGRRGVLTDKQIFDLADAIGISPKELIEHRLAIANSYSAAEIQQLTHMLVEQETVVRDNMVKVANGGGDMLEFAASITKLEMLQGKAVAVGSDWGHAGIALQELRNATGARSVEQLNELLHRTTGRDYDSLMQLARQGQALPTPGQIGRVVRSTRPQMSRFGRAVTYLVTNSFLSGLNTHAVYLAGNNLRALLLQPLETTVNGMVGATREALNLGPRERAYMREVGAGLQGVGQGTWDGFPAAYEAYKAGMQPSLVPAPLASAANTHFFNSGGMSHLAEVTIGQPSKVVAGIHQFSRVQFYSQFLYQYALRQALDEGLSGNALLQRSVDLRNNAVIMDKARIAADTAMFQRQTPFGGLQSRLGGWVDQYAAAKILFPFMKIGFEMGRETLKRTPVAGALIPEVRNALMMRAGGAAFDEALGKQILGTSLLTGGILLAANGTITGGGPAEPGQRLTWAMKHQPYSLEVGNLSVPLGGLGPQFNVVKFAADLWEAGHYAKTEELGDLSKMYSNAVLHAALDEGFFKDIANLSEVISDPGRHGLNWITSLGMGFVPYSTGLSQINREWIDPYKKEVSDLLSSIKARIPGLSLDVPNQIDRFGNPIPTRGMRFDRYAGDPTMDWLDRLGVGPGKVDKSIWGVRLNSTQYNDLEILAGRMTKELLDNAVQAGIENAPRGVQIKTLSAMVGEARKFARAQVVSSSLGSDDDIAAKAADLKLQQLQ